MNLQDPTGTLARETARERAALARRARLAAIARCCHPRTWRRLAATALAGDPSRRRRGPQAAPCGC